MQQLHDCCVLGMRDDVTVNCNAVTHIFNPEFVNSFGHFDVSDKSRSKRRVSFLAFHTQKEPFFQSQSYLGPT